MSPGKLASQAGHAFVEALRVAQELRPDTTREYTEDPPGTKVVLSAKREDTLLSALAQAQALGVPAALITDSGHVSLPHFTGQPVVTALGLGPARRSEVQSITKRFQLLK